MKEAVSRKIDTRQCFLIVLRRIRGGVVVVVLFIKNPVLSLNDGGGRIYLIILEIVLTHNLHLERLLVLFNPTFLLCSTTAFSQVFFGLPLFLVHFTLKIWCPSQKIVLILSPYMSIPTDAVSFYKSMKNKAKETASKALREKA